MNKNIAPILATLFFLLTFSNLAAQEFDEKAAKKALKAKEVEILDPDWSVIKAKSRKNKKWGVFQWNGGNETAKEIVPFILDSLGSWFPRLEPFIVVKNNGKYDMLLNPYEIQDAAERLKFEYDRIQYKEEGFESFAVAQKNGKWGLVDWFDGFVVHPFVEDTPEDVPLIALSEKEKSRLTALRSKLNADLITFEGSGDGVFKARNKTSEKWGMYQAVYQKDIKEVIPMKYDSLYFYSFNGIITPVFSDGKMGLYLSPFSYGDHAKESVPCIYEDYQEFNIQVPAGNDEYIEKYYIGVKKNGKWGWIDWLTGEEKSDFIYATVEDLPFPHFYQETSFEE